MTVDLNIRLIQMETGAVITMAGVRLSKTGEIQEKLAQSYVTRPTVPGSQPSTLPKRSLKAGEVFFKEDFSKYNVGDPVDPEGGSWGEEVAVFELVGRKWLGSFKPGGKIIQQNVLFPENFSFEFEVSSLNVFFADKNLKITFIDDHGNELDITINAGVIKDEGIRGRRRRRGSVPRGGGQRRLRPGQRLESYRLQFEFPTTDWSSDVVYSEADIKEITSVKITRENNKYKIYAKTLNNEDYKLLISTYSNAYTRFVGFSMTVLLSGDSSQFITNFIGTTLD